MKTGERGEECQTGHAHTSTHAVLYTLYRIGTITCRVTVLYAYTITLYNLRSVFVSHIVDIGSLSQL